MANILIVSGSYFPNATANAVCVKKFEDALRSEGHQIIYCNRKHDLYEPDHHVYEGTELYTVGKNSDLFFQTLERLRGLDLPGKMSKDYAVVVKAYRALARLRRGRQSKEAVRKEAREHYLNSYAEKIVTIIRERSVDLILSVSMPFDSHCAVLQAMNQLPEANRPKWIAYCIDAYWSKAGVSEKDAIWMKEEERRVFESCDRILFLDTIEKDYSGTEYDTYRSKICALPLPLFDLAESEPYDDGITPKEDVSEIVYTGTVYDDFSNMDSFIHVAELLRGEPIRFHFIGKIYPKSLSQLEELQKRMPEQICIYGRMPYSFAKGSMQRADVLLNLANDNANQIPSKIFEYMMSLKPILNLYRFERDVGTFYLKKYPLSYNISAEDNLEEKKCLLLDWTRDVRYQKVSKDELESIYHELTSPVVCDRFCKLVTELIGDVK